jgi:hypothetical protein
VAAASREFVGSDNGSLGTCAEGIEKMPVRKAIGIPSVPPKQRQAGLMIGQVSSTGPADAANWSAARLSSRTGLPICQHPSVGSE